MIQTHYLGEGDTQIPEVRKRVVFASLNDNAMSAWFAKKSYFYNLFNLLHKSFDFLLENLWMKEGSGRDRNLSDTPLGIMNADEWNVWNFDESFCYQYLATMICRLGKHHNGSHIQHM